MRLDQGCLELWFDVGIKRYTTNNQKYHGYQELWFDVGIKRYTTERIHRNTTASCGLM